MTGSAATGSAAPETAPGGTPPNRLRRRLIFWAVTIPSAIATGLSLATAFYHGLRYLGSALYKDGKPNTDLVLAFDALALGITVTIAGLLAMALARAWRRETVLTRTLERERLEGLDARCQSAALIERYSERLTENRAQSRTRLSGLADRLAELGRRKDDFLNALDRESHALTDAAARNVSLDSRGLLTYLQKGLMELWIAHETEHAAIVKEISGADAVFTTLHVNLDQELLYRDRGTAPGAEESRFVTVLRDRETFQALKAGQLFLVSQSTASRAIYGDQPVSYFLCEDVPGERHLVCPDLTLLQTGGEAIDMLAAHEVSDPAARAERRVHGHTVSHLRLPALAAAPDTDNLEPIHRINAQDKFAMMRRACGFLELAAQHAGKSGIASLIADCLDPAHRAAGSTRRDRPEQRPPTSFAVAILFLTGHLKTVGLPLTPPRRARPGRRSTRPAPDDAAP